MKGMNDVMAKRNGSRWPLAAMTLAIALAGADMAAAGSLTNTAVANGRPARGFHGAERAGLGAHRASAGSVFRPSGDEARGATRRRMPPALRCRTRVGVRPAPPATPERTAATGM
ncbi:MAG: hypothetical protein H6891_06645 [Brucellaceae bacterium]|nr:hypothetical protein [Brucellaceae bacterium]